MLLAMFLLLLALLLIGVPVAIVLGCIAIWTMVIDGGVDLIAIGQRFIAANDSFPMLAVPFFMFAGSIMTQGGISKRLVGICQALVGHVRGGLAVVATVTAMFFAAISGSSAATTAAVGATLIPEMEKKGYDRDFSAAAVAAAGTTGIVIPPSTPMVIYGVVTGCSVGKLLMGGFVPGILLGIAMIIVIRIFSKKKGYRGVAKASGKEIWKAFKESLFGILMPVIILGGIYGGFFTPTEAAVVACLYGLIVSMLIYREVKIKDLPAIIMDAAKSTAMVGFILTTAGLFGWVLTAYRIPQLVASALMALSNNRIVIMMLINVMLLVVGCFLNATSAISILAPILYPVVVGVGMDPIAFGVIMTVNLAIGCITPPVGVDLFVAQSISKAGIFEISKNVMPFMLAELIVLAIITVFPDVIMIIPNFLTA